MRQRSHLDSVEIRLLPALPDEWQTGTFRGLRTRGGYEVGVEWDQGAISSASLRPVASRASDFSDHDAGDSAIAEAKPPRCRVLSRTRLKAVLAEPALATSDAGFPPDEEGVVEGGIWWYSVNVQALRPGEQVLLFPIGS